MTKPLDRTGTFKAHPIEWTVRNTPRGDTIVSVRFEAFEILDGDGWASKNGAVRGDFFVLKPTGAINEKIVEMLCGTIGWGGTFTEIHEGPPPTCVVQIDVESRDYKDKTYYEARWIRGENEAPRNASAGPTEVRNLDAQHGDALKAVAIKAKKTAPTTGMRDDVRDSGVDYGDIPFGWLLALPLLGVFL